MLEPQGPEPRVVYLRRRVALVAVVLVVLVAVVWIGSALGSGGSSQQPVVADAVGSTTTSTTPSAPATSTPATSTPATSTPATSTPATSTPATSTPATSTPATSTKAAPSSTPLTATEPGSVSAPACSDAAIGVTAQVALATYPVGGQPVVRLLITNTGPSACLVDLGASLQQVLVYSKDGTQRIWSSNDCFPGTGTDQRTLNLDEQAVYSIQWSGTTSTEGCTTPRVPAPAGQYVAMAVLGGLQSTPVPFSIV